MTKNWIALPEKPRRWTPGILIAFVFLLPSLLPAEVVRFEISERVPFADGRPFGDVGPYERIAGKVFYAVDPNRKQNRQVVDLQFAPRNEDGLVEFASDLFILAPKELGRGNRAVLYDVNNRGNKLALRFFNDTPGGNNPHMPGNGFLMRYGFTIVWSGWNGEVLPGDARLRLSAPAARQKDGSPVTGPVRYEIAPKKAALRMNVNRDNHGAYRPTEAGLGKATLTWRLRPGDPRVPIPRNQFAIHVAEPETAAPQLPLVELEIPAGFKKGYLYELIYEAQDPLVHGVCFASVRDLIAALKHGEGQGNPLTAAGNPVIQRAHGFGVSQSGRFLREFMYWGFNEDEQQRKVFDGLMPHVAGGGLGSFNHRFAQPTAFVTQRDLHDWPTDRFPFAYGQQTDPVSGRRDGILRRHEGTGCLPLVFHSQSTTEYWSRSGSLVHTDPAGGKDAAVPANVRVFAFGGTQHGPTGYPPEKALGQNLNNPADYRPLLRALLVALDRWSGDGAAPPDSICPTIAGGTLVDFHQSSTGFPSIPGRRYPEVVQQPSLLDFGPDWVTNGIISVQPPRVAGEYRVLVPKCGADGNELGCLLPPEVAVPLATFTGWNLRSREAGAENELVGLDGSYIPLPKTQAERETTGDPRPSLQERYGGLEEYRRELKSACQRLVERRLLLKEDVAAIVGRQTGRAKTLFDDGP